MAEGTDGGGGAGAAMATISGFSAELGTMHTEILEQRLHKVHDATRRVLQSNEVREPSCTRVCVGAGRASHARPAEVGAAEGSHSGAVAVKGAPAANRPTSLGLPPQWCGDAGRRGQAGSVPRQTSAQRETPRLQDL